MIMNNDDEIVRALAADPSFNPDIPRRPDLPTQAEWDLLFNLAGTGINECPWAWDEDFPAGYEYDECNALLAKIRTYLKTTGAY